MWQKTSHNPNNSHQARYDKALRCLGLSCYLAHVQVKVDCSFNMDLRAAGEPE